MRAGPGRPLSRPSAFQRNVVRSRSREPTRWSTSVPARGGSQGFVVVMQTTVEGFRTISVRMSDETVSVRQVRCLDSMWTSSHTRRMPVARPVPFPRCLHVGSVAVPTMRRCRWGMCR